MALEHVSAQVFNVELLRDRILEYVIQNAETISTADVPSLRLVNKAWLLSTSRYLHKIRKPLFHLYVDYNTCATGADYGKLLDKFVEHWTIGELEEKVPTFKMYVYCDLFRQENYNSLLNFLTLCGSSMVELKLAIPQDGGSMNFHFPNLCLPKLQSCTVEFRRKATTQLAKGEKVFYRTNFLSLLRQIFSNCGELKTLNICSYMFPFGPPYGFERLVLPNGISNLELVCDGLINRNLELLTRNHLPNLKELEISYINESLEDGIIFKILENFQNTLVRFSSTKHYYYYENMARRMVTYFKFPLMKNLRVFASKAIGLELNDRVWDLQNKLPKLAKLCLMYQTEPMFRKWTDYSVFPFVVELNVLLVDGNFRMSREDTFISFPVHLVKNINTAFPNLQKLVIHVFGTELCGLKSIFQKLQRLESLIVNATNTWGVTDTNCWDALLLGVPIERMEVFRKTGFLELKQVVLSSVKELTELKELTLQTRGEPFQKWKEADTLISDAPFQHAFYKMPKLRKIVLRGRFMASPETELEWKQMGKEFEYTNERFKKYSLE